MSLPFFHWLQTGTRRIQKSHLFVTLLLMVLPNGALATDCLVSPALPCTFTLTEPFNGANWPTQPIDFRYDGGFAMVKTAKVVNGNGTELPFQWVSSCWDPTALFGCIEIQDSLPAAATQTYTLEAGPPSASVSNPVVATNNVPCYSGGASCIQLTNGLTGVQVPTVASNGASVSYRLAPLQAIGLPGGGWTGAIGGSGNPNLIYAEASSGLIPWWTNGLQTPITTATGYSTKFVEAGPLKTVLQLVYSFNRPDYYATASKYYYGPTCTPASLSYPSGYISWGSGNPPPANGTVTFNAAGFCSVGAGSAPLDRSHYYTATPVPGVAGAYTLTTVVGGVVTPVIITGVVTGNPKTAFIINSASGCSNGCQDSAPGRLVVTVTMYANTKSILVLTDSDMLHAEYYPFYNELAPDTARFRNNAGSGSGDPRCGYTIPVSVTAVGTGLTTATITTASAVTNGQPILLTGVGSGTNLPNGVYYLQTTSPYSSTTPGVWTAYSGSTFSGVTSAPASYSGGGLVKPPTVYQHTSPVSDNGFDFPWVYGDTGFVEADPYNNTWQGCSVSGGHVNSTPPGIIDYPVSDAADVWAWTNYLSTGGGSSPVLGWFTGDAGLMKNAYQGRMPGLYMAASGFVSGWGRTTALEDANWLNSNGIPLPTLDNWGSQKSYGIWVSTNSDIPAWGSSTHPPIQDAENTLTGINLSHVYAYHAASTTAPSGGWNWLYMANSNGSRAGQEMNCMMARVKDGSSTCAGMFPDGRTASPCSPTAGSSCYHDLVYNSTFDSNSHALLNKWQSEKPYPYVANFGKATNSVGGLSTLSMPETVANTGDMVVAEITFSANSNATVNTGCTISASDGTAATFTLITGGNFLSGRGYSFADSNNVAYTALLMSNNAAAGSHTLTFTISGSGCAIYAATASYRDVVGGASIDSSVSTYLTTSSSSTSVSVTSGTIGTANELLLVDWFATAGGFPTIAAPFLTEAGLQYAVIGYLPQVPSGGSQAASITQASGTGRGFVVGIVPSTSSPAVGTALTASGCPAATSGIGTRLAAGDNHLDNNINYYQIGLYFEPCFGVWNDVLVDPLATAAQKSQVAAEAGLFGGLIWDNSWFPWDGSFTEYVPSCYGCFVAPSGDGTGLQNQQVQFTQDRASIVYQYGVNGANSFLASRVPAAAASTTAQIQQSIGCTGAVIGSTLYQTVYNYSLLVNSQITALQGSTSFANECQFHTGLPDWYLMITTPPDPRYGNLRKKWSVGANNAEVADAYPGRLATDLYATNATVAGWMSWLWHQYGSSTFQYHDDFSLLQIDETIPQVTPSLSSRQMNGYAAVQRAGTQGGGQETALWFVNGGNAATQPIYYSLQGHRDFDDGQVTIFALGAPLAMDWSADIAYPLTTDRWSHNSITFDAELKGTSWTQNNPPFQTYGLELLASPTVTASQAFGSSVQSAATYTYSPASDTGGDGTVWSRTVRTMAPDPNYPIVYVKDTFAGGLGGGKTLTWNLEALGAVSTPSGPKTPVVSFSNGCNPSGALPSANDTSGLAPYSLANGLQQFTFTGFTWPNYAGTNLKWNLYQRPTSGNAQWLIGNWGHGCGVGFELSQFLAANAGASWFGSSGNYCNPGNTNPFCDWQHILRVHDTGPFETVITPTVASGTLPSVSYSNGAYTATFGSNESLTWNDSYSAFTNGVIQILTTYNSSAQSAFGVSASGGPQEIANNGAGTITWTIEDVNPAIRTVRLPPGVWYPSVPVQQNAGVYTYYHAGGAEPSPAVVTFTQTPVTLRSVPLDYLAPPGAAQIRVKFGSSTNYAAIAVCNPLCSIVMESPVGTWPEQHDFLDGNGNVITSSQVRNVVVQ
jgi:hypothetical protein